jgi:cytochrome b561
MTKPSDGILMENRTYSPIYRIMHWAIAICMLLILFTIFLRLTWMNKDNMAEIIKTYFSTTDQVITQDQAIALARKIRKPMWDWHIYLGYVLVGLYSIRLILPFFGEMKFSNPFNKQLTAKVKFQVGVYVVFYICVAISLLTGLFIEFGPDSFKDPMEEVHVLSLYYLLAFIVLHFGGILMAEFSIQPGIISRIVGGNKSLND